MPKLIDETGNRYGRLTVIERAYPRGHRAGAYWLCECDCGNHVIVPGGSLRSGGTTSCGCKNNRRKTRWNFRQANETEQNAW